LYVITHAQVSTIHLLGLQSLLKRWLQIELNVLKFDYLLAVARQISVNQESVNLSTNLLEAFVDNAIRLYTIGFKLKDDCYQDAATLAVQGILVLHSQFVDNGIRRTSDPNDRLLLQAAFLSLHATAGEIGVQNRPLLLVSTRLHLHLGLGTIAFAQYSLARVKEMLQDTLSHHFMSRISQIHPFDAKGPKNFSPDAELSEVISTIKRMESKVDDVLYAKMQDFLYDQAIELLDFKRQLKGSLSKHLCLIERRRIARFKGVLVNSDYDLPLEGMFVQAIVKGLALPDGAIMHLCGDPNVFFS
jgi:N-terminal acetyltransferase B complex non-catalytic subunit